MAEKKRKILKIALIGLVLTLVVVAVGTRMFLPYYVKAYVNREIDQLDGYSGSVGDIDLHLWRSTYQIHDLKIFKDGGDIPVPFVDIKTSDLSLEWKALLHGAIVAKIDLYDADLNFAIGNSGNSMQTGEGAGWSRLVDALSPLDINRLEIHGGKLAFEDFSTQPPVNIFVKDISFLVENLKDVEDNNRTLPSPVRLSGNSIGNGRVQADGAMNILRDIPDFDFNIKLEKAALPSINDYSRSIAGVDFESGVIDIYIEAAAKDGNITGYIKPIMTDVSMVDIEQDKDPFSILWQSVVSVFAEIFKNHPEDQLATRIPLTGNINNPDTDTWSAFVGVFRNTFNAFIRGTDDTVDFSNVRD